jgi:hypothetical protein
LLGAALTVGLVLIVVPVLLRATIPPDDPAEARVAPYVEPARQSLLDNDDLGFPAFRYTGTLCASSDLIAVLFERRSYPYLTSAGAYAVTRLGDPPESGMFGGGTFVEGDIAEHLREMMLPHQTWRECGPD